MWFTVEFNKGTHFIFASRQHWNIVLYDAWCANCCGKYDSLWIWYTTIVQMLVMLGRPSLSVKHLTGWQVERKEQESQIKEKGRIEVSRSSCFFGCTPNQNTHFWMCSMFFYYQSWVGFRRFCATCVLGFSTCIPKKIIGIANGFYFLHCIDYVDSTAALLQKEISLLN